MDAGSTEIAMRSVATGGLSSEGTSSWQNKQSGMSAMSAAVISKALTLGIGT